jgi:hypothetical protein
VKIQKEDVEKEKNISLLIFVIKKRIVVLLEIRDMEMITKRQDKMIKETLRRIFMILFEKISRF